MVSYHEIEIARFKKYYAAGGVRACPESCRRVAMWEPETVFFLLSDQLGSTATVADLNGNETGKLLYKPWGESRYSSGSTPTACAALRALPASARMLQSGCTFTMRDSGPVLKAVKEPGDWSLPGGGYDCAGGGEPWQFEQVQLCPE